MACREIYERASIRFYKNKPIDDKIEKLIEAAIRAPTASGLENWIFVVFKSEGARKKLHELILKGHIEYYREKSRVEKLKKKFEEGMFFAPCYIGVFIERKGILSKEYEELELKWAIESAAMAIQNLMLKAVELKLGTCYIGVANFPGIEEEIKEMASLKDCFLVGLISVGYPEEKPEPRKRRKSIEEVVKWV